MSTYKWLKFKPKSITIEMKLKPNAKRNIISELNFERLVVEINEPPINNQANLELIQYLAKDVLSIPRSRLSVVKGQKSTDKVIAIDNEIEPFIKQEYIILRMTEHMNN